jgi:hypothetical protein
MAFDEIGATDFEEVAESENTEEVADLPDEAEDSGEKEPETAEPDSEEVEEQDSKTNAAFAELRRRAEEAEAKYAELQEQIQEAEAERLARENAIQEITGDDEDEAILRAIADAEGISVDEVQARIDEEVERQNILLENQRLTEQIEDYRRQLAETAADKEIAEDLEAIRKIDPSVKNFNDLPNGYEDYRLALTADGRHLSAEQAYFAAKAMAEGTKVKPPKEIGRVKETQPEKDYFTEAEVSAMTSEEKEQNWEKIMASLTKWKK